MWKAQIVEKYFQMRFFTFCLPSNIVNIDNSCQYRLLSENNSPPPPRLFLFRSTFARCDLPPLLFKTNLSYLTKKNTNVIWFSAWTVEIR